MMYYDDLKGYDDTFLFSALFPTYGKWVEQLKDYMVINKIDKINDDEETPKKIYQIIFNRYKNHYFRYGQVSTIYNKICDDIEQIYQDYAVMYDFQSKPDLTNTTNTETLYKTNNTSDENDDGYLTDKKVDVVDNSELYIKQANASVLRSGNIQRRIEEFRKHFMNLTNEDVLQIQDKK